MVSLVTSSSNYSTVLVDSVTNQIRYIAPKHQFQNWGPNQNPNLSLTSMMAQSNSCNVMSIANNCVGIGTINPQSLLHVVANSNLSTSSNSIIYDANGFGTGVFISGSRANNLSGLYISQYSGPPLSLPFGTTALNGDVTIQNNDGARTAIISSTTYRGIIVDGAGRVGINTGSMSNAFNVNGTAAFGTYANTATTVSGLYNVAIGGNLGINTASPGYPLHVEGSAYISNTLFASNMSILGALNLINAYTLDTSNVVINNQTGIGPGLTVRQTTQGGNGTIADFIDNDSPTVPVMRISDGGNIGIGTGVPGQKLHIYGTGATATPSAVLIDNTQETTPGGNPAQFLQFRNIVTGTPQDYFGIGAVYNGSKKLFISASGTAQVNPLISDAKLTIQQDGNVGIGNTSPTVALDVTGTIKASSSFSGPATNLTSIPSGQLTTTADLPYGALQTVSGLPVGAQGSSSSIPIVTVNTKGIVTALSTASVVQSQWTGTSPNPIYYTSNVGINTTIPTSFPLDVNGQTRIQHNAAQSIILRNTLNTNNSSELYFDSTVINANCTASIGIGTDTGVSQRGAYWRVNGTDRINILPSNGNVGIGSTGPAYRLDVAGTGNYQNTLSVNLATTTTDASVGQLYLFNPTNAANNNCSALIRVAGGTAGTPFLGFDVSGVSGWSIGQLNAGSAAANSLVIRNTNNFTSTNVFTFATTGTFTATTFSGSGASLTSIPAASLTGTNTLPVTTLPLSGVTTGSYGSASAVPVITVDTYGRITSASTVNNMSSQWTTSNASIFITGSNVAIGTNSTPLFPLDVTGQIRGQFNAAQGLILRNTLNTNNSTEVYFDSTAINANCTASIGIGTDTGASQRGAYWRVNGADRMNIMTGGNIGIGTTNPSTLLHLFSTSSSGTTATITNTINTSVGATVQLINDLGSGSAANIQKLGSTFATNPNSLLITNTGTNGHVILSATGLISLIPGAGSFAALQTLANGVVSIGSVTLSSGTSTNKVFTIYDLGTADTPATATNFYGMGFNANTMRYQVPNASTSFNIWYGGATAMMQLNNGNLTLTGDVTAFGTISDKRFKENIRPMKDVKEIILGLHPVSYNWRKDLYNKEHAGEEDIGFIAQDVKEVCPLVVGEFKLPGEDETYYKVKYEKIVPYLVKTVQDLIKENEELRKDMKDLQAKVKFMQTGGPMMY